MIIQRVFISYARTDTQALARRLAAALIAAGKEAWFDTAEIRGGAVWSLEIERAIDSAEGLLALLSNGAYESRVCRAEQGRAHRKDKQIIPILAMTGSDRTLFAENEQWIDFTDERRFGTALGELLDVLEGRRSIARPLLPDSGPVIAVPVIPYFVERPDEMAHLLRTVLSDREGQQVALTAVRGMGGVGKTALAAALCHTPEIRDAFPDGVVWITFGGQATTLEKLNEASRRLGDADRRYLSIDDARDGITRRLRNRSMLVVVDDVWSTEQIRPFLVDTPRSRILFTTRIETIAAAIGATTVTIGSMANSEAKRLLENAAGRSEPEFEAIVGRVGGLPLALKLAGRRLAGGLSAADWLARFTKVSRMRSHRDATDRDESVEISIALSTDALHEVDRTRFESLGVFREDVPVPFAAVAQFWGLSSDETEEILDELARLALIDVDRHAGTIGLHDIIRLYVRERHDYTAANQRLLETWNPDGAQWSSLADDGYFRANLVHHLVESGRAPEVHALLRETNESGRNAWHTVRRDAGDAAGYTADLDVAWRLASEDAPSAVAGSTGLAGEIFCALCRSSVQSVSIEMPPALVAALVRHHIWDIPRARRFADETVETRDQVRILLDLAALPGDRRELLNTAVERARNVDDQKEARELRQEALIGLCKEGHAGNAIRTIEEETGEERRSDAVAVTPFVEETQQRQLLLLARLLGVWGESDVVIALLPLVRGELRLEAAERAVELAREVAGGRVSGKLMSEAVAALAGTPRATELMPEALAAIFRMPDGEDLAIERAANAIVSSGFTGKALEALDQLIRGDGRARAARALARSLPEAQRLQIIDETLDSVRGQTWDVRAPVGIMLLAEAAPEKRDALVQEACALAGTVRMYDKVFIDLLRLLPPSTMAGVTPLLTTLDLDSRKPPVVAEILKRDTSDATLDAIATMAAAMDDRRYRGEIYAAISRYKPKEAKARKWLRAALQKPTNAYEERDWAYAAIAALPMLDGKEREEVAGRIFDVARHDDYDRISILVRLASTGGEAELLQIARMAGAFAVQTRRLLLAAVAPRISREGLIEVLEQLGRIRDTREIASTQWLMRTTAATAAAPEDPRAGSWSGIPDEMILEMFESLPRTIQLIDEAAGPLRLLGIELARRGDVSPAAAAARVFIDHQHDIHLLPQILRVLTVEQVETLLSELGNVSEKARVRYFAPLLPFVGERTRKRVLRQLIAICKRTPDQAQAAMLVPLAGDAVRRFLPFRLDLTRLRDTAGNYLPLITVLPFLDDDQLRFAWTAAEEAPDPDVSAQAKFILASRMPDRLHHALESVTLMAKLERAPFVTAHAWLYAAAEDQQVIHKRAMQLASILEGSAAPEAMITCLASNQIRPDDITNTLHALVSTPAIDRRGLFAPLVPFLMRLDHATLRSALSEAIRLLARHPRPQVLEDLQALHLPIWRAAGTGCASDVVDHIRIVTRWWP